MEDLEFNKFESKEVQVEKPGKINFQQIPTEAKEILDRKAIIDRYTKDEVVPMPMENPASTSYLQLVLSPNLKDLELMIRGLEYVKRFNPIIQRDEIILRKIEGHPLNEYGINTIMNELRIYTSPEIKLGRKRPRDYYNSVRHVGYSIVRLIYKNLKNFGMDSQEKQRHAKRFCNAIIEFIDAAYSRSLEGRENDLSRATELKIEGSIQPTDLYQGFSKEKKEQLKN